MYQAEQLTTFYDKGRFLTQKYSEILEGIENDWTKIVTAHLLENEAQYLDNLSEDTRLINVGSFDKYVFPLVRRTYPTLIVNDIVSVQPMTSPQGIIFYLKFKYGTNKGAIVGGSEYMGDNVAGFDETYSSDTVKTEKL